MLRAAFPVVLICALGGAPAHAQVGVAAPSAAQRAQAEQDLTAGQSLLKDGRYEAALARLQAAYAVVPSAAALQGIGAADRALDRPAEAYRAYEKLLARPAAELTADDRAAAERSLADLDVVTGTVKLTLAVPDAAYTLDDRPIDTDLLAHPFHLLAGRHVFGASKPGFAPLAFPVWITVGKSLETSLVLKPLPGTAPPPAPPSPPPPVPAPAPPAPAATPPPPAAAVAPRPTPPAPAPPPAPAAPATLPAPQLPAPATPSPPPPPEPSPLPPPPPLAPLAPVPPPVSASAPPFPESMTPPSEPSPPANPFADGMHLGLMLGVIALPRPLEGEVVVKLNSAFALSLKGSLLPELSIPGADVKLGMKAVTGILRWFPFQGIFYLGGGLGYQSFIASIGQSLDNAELTTTADMSSFFLAPEIGVLWVSSSGVSLGFGIGVQIPIPKDPVVTSTYNGQPVPPQSTSSVPPDVIAQAQSSASTVHSIASFLIKYPLPTLDLLRIGIFF